MAAAAYHGGVRSRVSWSERRLRWMTCLAWGLGAVDDFFEDQPRAREAWGMEEARNLGSARGWDSESVGFVVLRGVFLGGNSKKMLKKKEREINQKGEWGGRSEIQGELQENVASSEPDLQDCVAEYLLYMSRKNIWPALTPIQALLHSANQYIDDRLRVYSAPGALQL